MNHEALSTRDEQEALWYRNQQKGVARNIAVRGIKVATAERAGTLNVVEHDKALAGHHEDMKFFTDEAAQHVEANLGAYIETARVEAEAAGHNVDPQRPE